jgi:uncharacterized protein YjeT (DUF2065 family)
MAVPTVSAHITTGEVESSTGKVWLHMGLLLLCTKSCCTLCHKCTQEAGCQLTGAIMKAGTSGKRTSGHALDLRVRTDDACEHGAEEHGHQRDWRCHGVDLQRSAGGGVSTLQPTAARIHTRQATHLNGEELRHDGGCAAGHGVQLRWLMLQTKLKGAVRQRCS